MSKSDDARTSRGGLSFCSALFLLFLGLRLTDHVDWAWYWVAAPLWIPLAIAVPLCAVYLIWLRPRGG